LGATTLELTRASIRIAEHLLSLRSRLLKVINMPDVIYTIVLAGFFYIAWLFARACDRL